jgi:glycine/D-amino acid oxidase-like deaminating enzyme
MKSWNPEAQNMSNPSIWKGTTTETDLPVLREDLTVDVAIVGGGITGLMTALQLSEAGKRVAVLEARRIGTGTTGFSKCTLSYQQGPHRRPPGPVSSTEICRRARPRHRL